MESPAFVPSTVVLAVLVRLAWIVLVPAQPIDDFSWYWDRGVELARGEGLVFQGAPTAYWPVGYPLLLAGLFRLGGVSLTAAKLANVAMYAGAMLCIHGVVLRTLGDRVTARLTLLALALYPNQIAYASLTATETPFLLLMSAGTLVLLAWGRRAPGAAAAGTLFGLGCLVKPTMLFVPAVVLAFQWLAGERRRFAARAVLAYAALALTIAPWIVRNYRVYGAFVLIDNNGGINLLIGNNPDATGGYADVAPDLARRLDAAPDERARDVLARDLAIDYVRTHPARTLAMAPRKVWYLYYKDVEGLYWNEMAIGRGEGTPVQRPLVVLKIAAQAFWVVILLSFAAGLVRLYLLGRPPFAATALSAIGLGLAAYFTAISVVAFGSTRLHFPVAPFLVVYAAAYWSLALGALPAPVPRRRTSGIPAVSPVPDPS